MAMFTRRDVPIAFIFLWLTLLGILVGLHAYRTQQPPIYDALTYYEKAQHFWANLSNRHISNPLNLAPSFRPPGTVLMSYPLGFDLDFRGFYFRSAFLPVLLIGLAVLIVGYRRDSSTVENGILLATAILLTSLPTFYHFDMYPGLTYSNWGLVDNFLGGVAALALACLARSAHRGSWSWLVAGALAATLCILIKPAGVLLAALVAVVWGCLAIHALVYRVPLEDRPAAIRRFLWQGAVLATLLCLCVIAAMRSQYLSKENLDYGGRAIAVMRDELNIHFDQLIPLLRDDIGFAVPAWMAVMLVATIVLGRPAVHLPAARREGFGRYVALSAAVMAVGLWFWLVASGGGTQVRYFDPFLMLSAIIAVPSYSRSLARLSKKIQILIALMMVIPGINIMALLMQRDPSMQWQQWSGVNVKAGVELPALVPARDFVKSFQDKSVQVNVYSVVMSHSDALFTTAFLMYMASHPEGTRFSMYRPVDWQRPTAFRAREILRADYLLNAPLAGDEDASEIMRQKLVPTAYAEQRLFRAWVGALGPQDGVETFYRNNVLQLLRISDAPRFSHALNQLIAAHEWREIFRDANPKEWWSHAEVDAAVQKDQTAPRDVRFGDEFEMSAIHMTTSGRRVDLRFLWTTLKPVANSGWSIFVHAVDSSGKILLVSGVDLGRILASPEGRPYHFDSAYLDLPAGTAKIAVGFYRDGKTLLADRGDRDWDGHRLLLSVPASGS